LSYLKESDFGFAFLTKEKRIKFRFDTYSRVGLLCGNDGLPHLVADPGFAIRFEDREG